MLHKQCVAGIVRICEDGHSGDFGDDLLEHLQLLPDQRGRYEGQPGDVSSWAREAGDESRRHRITNVHHDDGDRLGRFFAAWVAGKPAATMTFTLRRTSPAAGPGSRSYCPSAHRNSMAMF